MTSSRCWVARAEEQLGRLLEREGVLGALADGRVFVNGQRVSNTAEVLVPGTRVEVYTARTALPTPVILAELDGLVVVDKPAGIATEPERRGARGVVTHQIASKLGVPVESVHALSRLDLGVSGVVLLGLTQAARRRVTELREHGRLHRRYVAIASSTPAESSGVWSAPLGAAAGGPKRRVSSDGKPASTRFRVTGHATRLASGAACVLALEPVTGRTHQLRVHASEHGAPLWGDPTYGGPRQLVLPDGAVRALNRVFLHACWVELGEGPRIRAPLPEGFATSWSAVGGDPSALALAIDAQLPE